MNTHQLYLYFNIESKYYVSEKAIKNTDRIAYT